MQQDTVNNVPEGYTEDEMGLLRDPEAMMGGQNWSVPPRPVDPIPSPDPDPEEPPAKKRKPLRVILIVVAILIVILLAVGGIGGFMLMQSVNKVRASASDVQAQASTLKDAFMKGDEQSLRSSSASIKSGVDNMQAEMSSPIWSLAEAAPVVGTDVKNARALVSSASELTNNALDPLVDGLAGIKFSDLMQEGRVDCNVIKRMRDSVVKAAPVIVAEADKLSKLPTGSVAQVNEIVDKLRDPLSEVSVLLSDADGLFSTVLHMLGDGGQTRNYVLVAQTNSEARSAGGFPGSIGLMTITDGVIELGDFESVYKLKEASETKNASASITSDEHNAFFDSFTNDVAAVTFTPNFVRVGEMTQDWWAKLYNEPIEGVFGLDPIFVQRMLRMTNGTIVADDIEINGDNAAEEILSNVYWRYGDDVEYDDGAQEDEFFNTVARESASYILSSLGKVDFDKFLDVVIQSGKDRRVQVWMVDPKAEDLMRRMGISGELESDRTKPEIGLYANDFTWSKISWYLDISADVSEGRRNEDGTTTYHVTGHFRNNMTGEEADTAPVYICGDNPEKRTRGDMIDVIYVMAPLGGTISNYQSNMDEPLPEGMEPWPDENVPVYERDTWRSQIHINPGGDSTVTFDVTVPAEATEPLAVRTSPSCHDAQY